MNMKEGKEPFPKTIQGKREMLFLNRVLTKGDMVLLYKESEDELKSLDKMHLAKRLYIISGFEKRKDRTDTIKLVKHNYAAVKDEGKGKSIANFDDLILQNKIQMAINKVKFVQGILL
jgi:hypothetical protein